MADLNGDERPAAPAFILGGYAAKQCARRLHNDFDPNIDNSLKLPDSAAVRMRMDEGNVFEADVAAVLAGVLDPAEAVFLTGDRSGESLNAREAATAAAMDAGVRFIWNPRLTPQRHIHKTGEPDALVRYGNSRADNGRFAYLGVDVKHHRPFEGTSAAKTWLASPVATPWPEAAADLEAAGTPQLVDSMQLAHYHRMLEELGSAGPAIGGIIGKPVNGQLMVVWRELDAELYLHDDPDGGRSRMSALDIYDHEFDTRVDVAARALERGDDPELPALVGAEWKGECKECPWRQVCHDELVEAGHITLLQGVTPARAKAHYATGISTISALARLDWPTAVAVDAKLDVPSLIDAAVESGQPDGPSSLLVPGRLLKGGKAVPAVESLEAAGVLTVGDVARLDRRTSGYSGTGITTLAGSIDQARVVKADRVHRARGVDHVAIPRAAVELDVDMENDEHIYLWGVQLTVRSRGETKESYHPFVSWDGTDEGEANAFVEFWAFLTRMQTWARSTKVGGFKAYYYTQAETRCLRALVAKHAGKPGVPTAEELEAFIASDDWVDMFEIIAGQTLWPTEDMSVKSVAKRCGFAWRDADAGGGNSVSWYRDAVSGETPEIREENRTRVLSYNEDDVLATRWVRDWLSRLGQARRPGDKLPSVSDLDARFGRRRTTPAAQPTRAA